MKKTQHKIHALPVIILGMHKSGTTLLSKTLHLSGINMVDEVFKGEYDEGNKWERSALVALNKSALKCGNKLSLYVNTPIKEKDANWEAVVPAIKKEVSRLNMNHDQWGFKDPRTCMTYLGWNSILPEHKLICVIRHPYAIWPRYRRVKKRGGFLKRMKSCLSFIKCYNAHLLSIESAARNHSDYRLFCYDQLLASEDWKSQLKDYLELEEIVDVRTRFEETILAPDIFLKCSEFLFKAFRGIDIVRQYENCKAL